MPTSDPWSWRSSCVIVLIIFGPKRLPGLGRQLGSGMREFKDSITGKDKDDDEDAGRRRPAGRPRPRAPARPLRGRARGRHRRGAPRGPARLARRYLSGAGRHAVVRPVGHEDRLSLVEHLDELRTRLIVCIAAFVAAFSICYWQNHWLLEIVNQPLQSTQNLDGKKRSKDPLEESARFALRTGAAQKPTADGAALDEQALRRSARRRPEPGARAQLRAPAPARAAARAQAVAAAAVPTNRGDSRSPSASPSRSSRRSRSPATPALLLSLPFIL